MDDILKRKNVVRLVSGLGAVLLSTLLAVGTAYGQTLKDGTLTGEIRTATAETPAGTTTTVFFVPPDRAYIMTQACVNGALSGSILGKLSDGFGCTVFTPGIAFQPGELISLTARPPLQIPGPPNDASALITGVLVDLVNEEEDDDD